MIEKFTCPTCGWEHRLRPGTTRSVSWGDCACSDASTCLRHQYDGGAPSRPSEDVLLARLKERDARNRLEWEALRDRCAAAAQSAVHCTGCGVRMGDSMCGACAARPSMEVVERLRVHLNEARAEVERLRGLLRSACDAGEALSDVPAGAFDNFRKETL